MSEVNKIYHQRAGAIEQRLAKAAAHERNPQIQEAVFCRDFLPMFVGGGEFINQEAWVAVAGSVNNEVDVFRDREYLYTLPSLAIPIVSEISSRKQDALGMQGTWASTGGNAMDEPGSLESVHSIAEHGHKVTLASSPESHLKRWEEVFKRYDLDYKVIRAQIHERKTGQKVNPDIVGKSNNTATDNRRIEIDEDGDYEPL